MSEAIKDFEEASNLYESSDYQGALRALSWGFRKDVNYKPLYTLSVKALSMLEATQEATLFIEALNHFDQFEPFNNLGTHFFDAERYDLSIPFLEKAILLDASMSDTAHDLALAYSRTFQIDKALEVLETNHHHENDFWSYWFWCKLRILNNMPDGIEEALDELNDILNQMANQQELEIPRQKVTEINEVLTRYHLIAKPMMHIRDWHFIQYGGAILDYFEDSDTYVAGGRYVATWGSNESINIICHKLKIFLESIDFKVKQVRYLDDKNSHIIGLIASKALGLNAQRYDVDKNSNNALIVGANTSDFDAHQEFAQIKKGQILFSLNHNWLESAYLTPDIIGFMSQTYYFPWDGNGIKIIDAEKGITETSEPDNRDAIDIAADIFKSDDSPAMDSKILSYYKKHKEYLKAIGSKSGKIRYNYMIESPVVGSYFN
jgi:tetratricopeptide (TPR) repeat protein